jgi:hypothetical protein
MKDASGKKPPVDRRREQRKASRVQKTFEDNVRARLIAAGGQKTQTSKSRAREGREGMNDANGETPRASN